MLEQASVGAFLNVTSSDPQKWREDLQALEELPIGHLELWLEYEPSMRELAAIASMLDRWPRIMHAPFIGMSLATHWDGLATLSLDRCHRAIEAAGILGCQVVTLHAGPYAKFMPREEALSRLAERLSRFARLTSPTVAVENMPARAGVASEALTASSDLDELAALLPTVSVTLDVGHCLQNEEDPAAAFTARAERIRNIHLHDGERGGRSHQALGTGDLDLASFLRALEERDYDGFLTIETLSTEDLRRSLDVLIEAGVSTQRTPVARTADAA